MKKRVTISEAVEALAEALREDSFYWDCWKSNIAMAFKDAVVNHNGNGGIHQISNDAAEQFLRNLVRETTYD